MSALKGNHNHLKHGLSHTRIDNIYKSMITRCYKESNHNYYKYGARGITICDEWLNNKIKFFEWAFANGYTEELTIDRIDNSKGYSPENCRWTTYKEQNNNRRSNRFIEAFGQIHTMTQWSEITGIKSGTIWNRLHKGWTPEFALTAEVSPYRKVNHADNIQTSTRQLQKSGVHKERHKDVW